MKLSLLTLIATSLTVASAALTYKGVNSAGGEFAEGTLPGTLGTTYQFIDEGHIDTLISDGVNIIRLPHLMERLCPPSSGLGSTFSDTYWGEYLDAIEYITGKGAYVLIDPHNYMRYNGGVIGSDGPSVDDFVSYWTELAGRLKDNSKVIFGIMNEPHDLDSSLLLDINQKALDAIRDAGAKQLVLVPGNFWAHAGDWPTNSGNLNAITDSGDNFAFDMHQYFDSDFSGTSESCNSADVGVEMLQQATDWLKENNARAFLSEFAGGNNDICTECLNNVLDHMEENDEWVGWTYWAAGPMWGSYLFSVEPEQGPEYDNVFKNILKPRFSSSVTTNKADSSSDASSSSDLSSSSTASFSSGFASSDSASSTGSVGDPSNSSASSTSQATVSSTFQATTIATVAPVSSPSASSESNVCTRRHKHS